MSKEAEILGTYLLKQAPDAKSAALYDSALERLNLETASDSEGRSFRLVMKHPSLLALADSSDALFHPRSLLRKKLFVMFAILESRPQYTGLFLPEKRAHNSLLYALWMGMRGGAKALLGRVVLFFG